jgi:hypothetical protein
MLAPPQGLQREPTSHRLNISSIAELKPAIIPENPHFGFVSRKYYSLKIHAKINYSRQSKGLKYVKRLKTYRKQPVYCETAG